MYKSELVRRVAKETRLTQRVVSDVVAATLREITLSLSKEESITFPGFGTFYTRRRPASEVRSLQTGKTISVPALTVAGFRVGELLKKAVRGDKQPSAPKRRRLAFLR